MNLTHYDGFPFELPYLNVTYLLECSPELSGHEAVDDEVDAAVEERHHVHQVTQRGVALEEESLPKHHAKEG